MTRINVIPVEELTQKELGGEWKEFPRLFTLVKNRVIKGDTPETIKGVPPVYTLGTGHVKFFYAKISWAVTRYEELCGEMLKRGYEPNLVMFNDILDDVDSSIPEAWWGDYEPTPEAIQMNLDRMRANGTR